MRIFIFGDSITQGFYDSKGGWAQRLINQYHMKTLKGLESGGQWIEMFNLGISGDTAEGVHGRMDSEIAVRQLYVQDTVIIIAIGCNDSILKDNLVVTEEYDFEAQIEELVDKALEHTSKVLVVGLAPVDQKLTDPWKYSTSGKQWKNNRIDLFEDILKQVSGRKEVLFVPVYDALRTEQDKGTQLHADGLHPNDKGHQMIAALVKPKLEELLK